MILMRNGEMHRKNWERIHQQLIFIDDLQFTLYLRPVFRTKETRPFLQCLLRNVSSSGYDSCGIELHIQFDILLL